MDFTGITINCGGSHITVLPELGGLVSSLQIHGRETLFMDQESYENPEKRGRGGIPLLFPNAGELEEGIFDQAETQMPKHGFLRNKALRVAEQGDDKLRLTLDRDREIKEIFPYRFATEITYQALAHGLQIELLIMNLSDAFIPLAPGWHPYFPCPGEKKSELVTDLDDLPVGEIQGEREFDFGVTAPLNGRAVFTIPNLGKLTLSYSPDMRFLQFWSLPGRDFICIEPFLGPPNALNKPDQRLEIPPHGARTLIMRIEFSDIVAQGII